MSDGLIEVPLDAGESPRFRMLYASRSVNLALGPQGICSVNCADDFEARRMAQCVTLAFEEAYGEIARVQREHHRVNFLLAEAREALRLAQAAVRRAEVAEARCQAMQEAMPASAAECENAAAGIEQALGMSDSAIRSWCAIAARCLRSAAETIRSCVVGPPVR